MTVVVADTSALVSLGASEDVALLDELLREYDVVVPEEVIMELGDVASYDDRHARAAERAVAHTDRLRVETVELDPGFPLDDGENAAVTLANREDAGIFLCDEFNSLGLMHASLSDVRLVTTPKLLEVFVHRGLVSRDDAVAALDEIAELRSWEDNSYVGRARELLTGDGTDEHDTRS